MRVLVTGHRGRVGGPVVSLLAEHGHEPIGFDVLDGRDVRDAAALRGAAAGCEAVVHLAALLPGAPAEDAFAVNVTGTHVVLDVAEAVGVGRVVHASSVHALGVFGGEGAPDRLPIDDDHPCRPSSVYGITKRLSEELCRLHAACTGRPVIVLRPPAVWSDATMAEIAAARERDPAFEWTPDWEYGAFVHEHDLAEAVRCALTCPDPGPAPLLVNADDVSSASATSRELARRFHPDVPWRGGEEHERDPYRALVDASRARRVLSWTPRRRWREREVRP